MQRITKIRSSFYTCEGVSVEKIGKYHLLRTIGEGAFAKVKLALNTKNNQYVAIKIIDKQMVKEKNLMHQVLREIRTMRLLHHPNIVRIHEVIGTKTKIYIVMEYVSGGQLSDKMSYLKKLKEIDARIYFQQLIDAVDYCHSKGVYHRDLKPQNLLIDSKGNLKVSDFGLSTLRKPGTLLSTACGSPSYAAPELLSNKAYEGAAADIWSCGVILFELLAGYLPFDDSNLTSLYRKLYRAEYKFPQWFTTDQKKLISKMLVPNPIKRVTIAEILEDQWFQTDYEPVMKIKSDENINMDDFQAVFDIIKGTEAEIMVSRPKSFINAFQLIATSQDLDLSGLFEEQESEKQKTKLGCKHTISETIQKIEAAAKDASLSVEKINTTKMRMHPTNKMGRHSKSCLDLAAEVTEVTPKHCVVQISKSAGELKLFKEFCESLSSMLTEESCISSEVTEM
ncbi:CBL-interacting serine/threonine-protein kinase 21 [Forsythia ovata]|uniref:non-specific serine/threonine protein kinase n=1 Tax=Forsythia ovata TaxID=205694 RepID=A0ABD1SQ47_9LAMI